MAFVDYYKILGVSKDIPQKDVKRAYLKRAKQFHPDLHPDDAKAKAKFQALNEAYEVIGDPEKRKKYDQYGEQWREADAMGGGFGHGGFSGGGGSPFEGFDFSQMRGGGFSSFFKDLFGGTRMGGHFNGFEATSHAPQESHTTVTIDMYTALLGGDVVIVLPSGQKIKLKVNPGTQPNAKVRLRGKGQGGNDLIITYQVILPSRLTDHQRDLLLQMRTER